MSGEGPLIAYANYFQFGRSERVAFGDVRSRMLLWCKAGRGRVRINHTEFEMQPSDVVLTPWRHAIAYTADAREPFFLAGIHLIPRQRAGTPLVREAAHEPGALPHLETRRLDADWPRLRGTQRGHFDEDSPLQALADYVVRRVLQQAPGEPVLCALAALLRDEMEAFFTHPHPTPRHRLTIDLQRAVQFIDDHVRQPVYLPQVAQVANRSLSWLHRQFRAVLHTTPTRYIIATRIRTAKYLLATSSQSVGEVGQAVGIDDPYYFSTLFKRHVGVSPRAYRRRTSLF